MSIAQTDRTAFLLLAAALLLGLLGGGGSNPEVLSLLYLRPLLVLLLGATILFTGPRVDPVPAPLLFLGALGALMLIQLVPLPSDLWQGLPGRDILVRADTLTGRADAWRPMTMDVDFTFNSLLALLPAFAVACGMWSCGRERWPLLVPMLIGAIAACALLGVLQVTAGTGSAFYLFSISSDPWPVGFFANRNHFAAFLAIGFPLLRVWAIMPSRSEAAQTPRMWIAAGLAVFFAASLVMTGSRAGLALGAIGVVSAAFLFPSPAPQGQVGLARFVRTGLVIGLPVLLVLAALALGRLPSLQRLIATDTGAELRGQWLPTVLQMVQDYFPVGNGFGVFEDTARMYEPDALLSPSYFNHAHSDPLEFLLNGGVIAGLLAAAFLAWTAWRGFRAVRPFRLRSAEAYLPRLGLICVLLLLAGSMVDYPLRTPLLTMVFTLCCMWLSADPAPTRRAKAR